MECREIVDSAKESPIEVSGCKDCDKLQILFNENPGGKPIRRTGLILAAIVGKKSHPLKDHKLYIYRLIYYTVSATFKLLSSIQSAISN